MNRPYSLKKKTNIKPLLTYQSISRLIIDVPSSVNSGLIPSQSRKTRARAQSKVYMQACMHAHMCMYACVRAQSKVGMQACMHAYMCMCACIHVCICACICISSYIAVGSQLVRKQVGQTPTGMIQGAIIRFDARLLCNT